MNFGAIFETFRSPRNFIFFLVLVRNILAIDFTQVAVSTTYVETYVSDLLTNQILLNRTWPSSIVDWSPGLLSDTSYNRAKSRTDHYFTNFTSARIRREGDQDQRGRQDQYSNQYYYDPYLNGDHPPASYGKGPVYKPDKKKKFPRFFGPFPLGFTFRDPLRPFPESTLFIVSPTLLIPFIPFGVFEFRFVIGIFVNYVIERLNGYKDSGRNFRNDQYDFYGWIEDLLTNTMALDGKACVQRLICELAAEPIDHLSYMGDLLHYIVEPRRGGAKALDEYVEAQLVGHKTGQCRQRFQQCPFSILNLIDLDHARRRRR